MPFRRLGDALFSVGLGQRFGLGNRMAGGDSVAPTVTITCVQSSPSSASPLNFTFTLSEVATDFAVGDITVGNGSASNFAGSGTSYTCDITPNYAGSVTVDIAAGAFHDAAGNANIAATQFVMVVFVAAISPTIGNTITIDGDMEAAGVTSWAAAGTPTTREKSGAQVHGGSQSLHVITDAGGEGAQQTLGSQTPGQWFHISAWGYVAGGDASMLGSAGFIVRKDISAAAWTQLFGSDLLTGASPKLIFRSNLVAASEFYIDDVYQKPLTLTTCMKTPRTGVAVTNVGANVTASEQHKIGVVANLDSMSTPLNYVLAVIDTTKAWLFQVSNGTYTAKINGTAITYVADKVLEIRHTDATTYQLWYNGAQVGADQTINDAAINNNTLYCQFSTYVGNTFSSFTL